MIDYKLLQAFAAVVEAGNFDKAAKRLHITQSAVSQRVKLLEEQKRLILLIRSSPPRPSHAGTKYLTHFKQVEHLENQLQTSNSPTSYEELQKISIAINADSIGTWFYPIIEPYLKRENIILDLLTDDQDQTHKLLRDGKVLACIGTHSSNIQGCHTSYLGSVKYGLFCSHDFFEKWFKNGVTPESLKHAPALYFNRKDKLNHQLFRNHFKTDISTINTFYIPSTELFPKFIMSGLGYGAIPEHQSNELLAKDKIIDITEGNNIEVKLFYHCWNLNTDMLLKFSNYFVKATRAMLDTN